MAGWCGSVLYQEAQYDQNRGAVQHCERTEHFSAGKNRIHGNIIKGTWKHIGTTAHDHIDHTLSHNLEICYTDISHRSSQT